jgi:hypothetical protein
MFALNFGTIYLFDCLDLVEGMKVMKEVKWLHMMKKKSCLKNSNLCLKHINKHFNIKSHFKWWKPCMAPTKALQTSTYSLFLWENIYIKKKITLSNSKINVNKVCIATQGDHQVVISRSSSTSCPNQSVYHFVDVVFYFLNLQHKLHPSNLLIEPTKN